MYVRRGEEEEFPFFVMTRKIADIDVNVVIVMNGRPQNVGFVRFSV